jgi:hypothetical protein
MNSRLENLIEKYLGSYVQEYDSSSLSVLLFFVFLLTPLSSLRSESGKGIFV